MEDLTENEMDELRAEELFEFARRWLDTYCIENPTNNEIVRAQREWIKNYKGGKTNG